MATLLTAGVLLLFIALVVSVLVYVHNRDQKREADKIHRS